ncbi:MAG TPA: lipid A biosynthesis acyltransferase [Ferruginibacter sp.]|mgnify:CR=1 FL=1|nr:lipid A biosynthesis acyltransferase [Ferruginibacter sp.]HMP21050.1 lipid A biosynthesis acyltransferase [Ferruginibacter sp.]
MYYIVYGLLYLLSLLPFRVLYLVSDILFVLMYYGLGYRRKVVMGNLDIAFPEKSTQEKQKISKQFYRNFLDTFIETIKMISISNESFEQRCTFDVTVINDLVDRGKNIQLHCGHQMNWEYANWILAKKIDIPVVTIYAPLSNKIFDRLFYKIRTKYKGVLLPTTSFRTRIRDVYKDRYALGLAADQNPSNLNNAYWMYFFTKKAPFVTGPGNGAVKKNTAVFFVYFNKTRRGYYKVQADLIVENAASATPQWLTLQYRDYLEKIIRENPDNYLWTHRRWKHTFNKTNEIFQSNWIDNRV